MSKPISLFERIKDFFTSHYEVLLIRTERTGSVLPSLMSLVHCKKDRKSQEFMQRTGIWIVGRFHSRRKAERRAREEQRNNRNWDVKVHKFQGSVGDRSAFEGAESMSKLRRWLQSFRKFLGVVWHFCPLYFIIGGWMLCIVVLTVIRINGYLTANQYAIGIIAGVIALLCFLLGFVGSGQKELKV